MEDNYKEELSKVRSKLRIFEGIIVLEIFILMVLGGFIILLSSHFCYNGGGATEYRNLEAEKFNSEFSSYIGNTKSAIAVRELFKAIEANNLRQNGTEDNRMICIRYHGPKSGETFTSYQGEWDEADVDTTTDGAYVNFNVIGVKNNQGFYYKFVITANQREIKKDALGVSEN